MTENVDSVNYIIESIKEKGYCPICKKEGEEIHAFGSPDVFVKSANSTNRYLMDIKDPTLVILTGCEECLKKVSLRLIKCCFSAF